MTDKSLISKVYIQLMQLNIKKNKPPNQKMGERPKQTFADDMTLHIEKKKTYTWPRGT